MDLTLNTTQEHFVISLLDGKKEFSNGEVIARQRKLGLNYLLSPYVVVIINPDFSSVDFYSKDETIDKIFSYLSDQISSLGYSFALVIDSSNNYQTIISSASNPKIIEEDFITIRNSLCKKFDMDFFVSIGSCVAELKKVSESSADARELLGYRFQYSDIGVINVSNIVSFKHSPMFGPNVVFERVIESFEECNIGQMSIRIDELAEYVRHRPNVSKTSIRRTMIELIIRILNTAANENIEVEEVLDGRDPYNWILNQNHTEVIVEWIMQVSTELIARIKAQQEKEVSATVKKACLYIEENLKFSDLSLSAISNHVNLTSSYFSHLFKKEMGVGVNAYISDLRIDIAKKLLMETDLTNEEISRQVGFSSVSYFSKVFNNSTGTTPGQYRNNKN